MYYIRIYINGLSDFSLCLLLFLYLRCIHSRNRLLGLKCTVSLFFILGLNITSHGSRSVDSNFSLYCDIPSFKNISASWYRNETKKTDCSIHFCTITIDGNFSFTWNRTGISVRINPLEITENNVIWKCVTSSGKTANFTIILGKFVYRHTFTTFKRLKPICYLTTIF